MNISKPDFRYQSIVVTVLAAVTIVAFGALASAVLKVTAMA